MAIAINYIDDEMFESYNRRLTKTQKKRLKRQQQQQQRQLIDIKTIEPRTENQAKAFDFYDEGSNLLLHGVAGTGKTFISLYLALDEIFNGDSDVKSVMIVRSAVPTRNQGFVPGKQEEKDAIYELPYEGICTELAGRSDAYQVLKKRNIINFITTANIRGVTWDDTIIIVDECQNMSEHELDSIITRVGENSRIIFCGDYRQTDLNKPHDPSGIKSFMKILNTMDSFSKVEFDFDDIVRSGLVREYIIAKEKLSA